MLRLMLTAQLLMAAPVALAVGIARGMALNVIDLLQPIEIGKDQ